MEIKVSIINNEKIVQVCLHSDSIDKDILEYHKKVFNKYNSLINYVKFPFNLGFSHGQGIDWFIENTINDTDYWLFWDSDCIPTRLDYLQIMYDKVKDKETLMGQIQQSNHLKNLIRTDENHPYIGTSGMFLSKELYLKLGRPSFHFNDYCDTGELLTYKCEEMGYNVSAIWPKSCEELTEEECKNAVIDYKHKKSRVGCFYFGLGTQYGSLQYHAMCGCVPRSKKLFIDKCKEILNA